MFGADSVAHTTRAYPHIMDVFKWLSDAYPDPRDMASAVISNKPLHLAVLNDDPRYLTDGQICLQAVFHDSKEKKPHIPPLVAHNKTRTRFYNTSKNCVKYMNSSDQLANEPVLEFPNIKLTPYTPHFHFKDRYPDFLKDRLKLGASKGTNLAGPYQAAPRQSNSSQYYSVQIQEYQFEVVNIANTGYLAPVLYVRSYKRREVVELGELHRITSILYEPQVIEVMQIYRKLLVELQYSQQLERQKTEELGPNAYPAHEFAITSLIPLGHGRTRLETPFIVPDLENRVIKSCFEQDARNYNLSWYSDAQKIRSGICSFRRPLNPFPGKPKFSSFGNDAQSVKVDPSFFQQRSKEKQSENEEFDNSSNSSSSSSSHLESKDTDKILDSCSEDEDSEHGYGIRYSEKEPVRRAREASHSSDSSEEDDQDVLTRLYKNMWINEEKKHKKEEAPRYAKKSGRIEIERQDQQ